jgi:hypothetical protein
MASKYSVIQYVPDPIADERINFGVLAFDDQTVRVEFLHHWDRVRCFSKTDTSFLHDFAKQMKESAESGLLFPSDKANNEIPPHERLESFALESMNSIQFTQPRASLRDVESLIENVTAKFLVDKPKVKSNGRDRQYAARITTSKIREAFNEYFSANNKKWKDYFKHDLSGQKGKHDFDVVVANGTPYLAAHGISFEVQVNQLLIESVYWRVDDIKEQMPDFPIAVIALPPKHDSGDRQDRKRLENLYQKSTEILRGMNTQVLDESEVEPWAKKTLRNTSLYQRQ